MNLANQIAAQYPIEKQELVTSAVSALEKEAGRYRPTSFTIDWRDFDKEELRQYCAELRLCELERNFCLACLKAYTSRTKETILSTAPFAYLANLANPNKPLENIIIYDDIWTLENKKSALENIPGRVADIISVLHELKPLYEHMLENQKFKPKNEEEAFLYAVVAEAVARSSLT